MDPFMNAAVADLYVKQGLTKEAIRIYEKILKLDPNNAEIRSKLDAAMGRPTSATPPSSPAPISSPPPGGAASAAGAPAPAAPADVTATPKKSKVSYL
jgi:tetratricopeptide (TPR) repeat protein